MKKKILIFVNYIGTASETFISDEIEFLRKQESIELHILHYGIAMAEKNSHGLNLPNAVHNRWLKCLDNIDITLIKSLKYRNGWNGSLHMLGSFFKKHKFDTIYCHFGTNGKLTAQLKELGIISPDTKLVVRYHGLDMNMEKYGKRFYNILHKQGSAILYGTQMARQKLLYFGFKEQLIYLPVGIGKKNIVDEESLRSRDEENDNFRIVCVGRFIELKGHHLAVEILSKVSGEDFFLEIIGDGNLFETVSAQISAKGLNSRITLRGSQSHEEVFLKLRESHLYLYSGIYDTEGRCENQATSVLEAMAQGTLVLASALGGITDYLIDGTTGFLIEPGNIKKFTEKINWIRNNFNSDEIMLIRQNAIKQIRKNYCQEELNEKLLKVLTD